MPLCNNNKSPQGPCPGELEGRGDLRFSGKMSDDDEVVVPGGIFQFDYTIGSRTEKNIFLVAHLSR